MNGTATKYTRVALKSPTLSKINWTAAGGLIVSLLVLFGVDVDEETRNKIVAGLIAIQSVATVIFKTWFSNTVTPQAMGRDDA